MTPNPESSVDLAFQTKLKAFNSLDLLFDAKFDVGWTCKKDVPA